MHTPSSPARCTIVFLSLRKPPNEQSTSSQRHHDMCREDFEGSQPCETPQNKRGDARELQEGTSKPTVRSPLHQAQKDKSRYRRLQSPNRSAVRHPELRHSQKRSENP